MSDWIVLAVLFAAAVVCIVTGRRPSDTTCDDVPSAPSVDDKSVFEIVKSARRV